MAKVRLKAVCFDVDFRYNEFGIYEGFRKSKSFPGDLGKNEVFLFVSRTGNQLLWVLNLTSLDAVGSQQSMIDTRRWRLSGSYWNPMMLANYAADVGLDLVGIKRFEELYDSR